MSIDELVAQLHRPVFNYVRARAVKDSIDPAMRKSAKTRMENAAKEIDLIVKNYANS